MSLYRPYYPVNCRKFPEKEDVVTIIESFGYNLFHSMRPNATRPGQIVAECDEVTREKFRNLKSEDLANIRPDWVAEFLGRWI